MTFLIFVVLNSKIVTDIRWYYILDVTSFTFMILVKCIILYHTESVWFTSVLINRLKDFEVDKLNTFYQFMLI